MMSQPYYGDGTPSWLHDVAEPAFRALYEQAGKPFDFDVWSWPSRLGYDVGAGLTKDASLAKHLIECADELGITPPSPIPVPRGPLPPFDPDAHDPETHAFLPVAKTLNGIIPGRSLRYMRANLWGMTVPGLPKVPGGASGPAQERMLTYLLQQYPVAWQDTGLRVYGERGYTHWWLSWPDARVFGLSVADYVALARLVKAAGHWPCHMLRSKDFDGRNPNPALIDDVVAALLAEDLIPMASHAWEASLFYDPAALRATIDRDATRWPQIVWCVHLQQGYADFGPDGEGHGPAFWKANIAVGVKRLLYQYKSDPPSQAWTAGMMQARSEDVSMRLIANGLWQLPETVEWVAFELIGEQLFNNQRDGDGRLADEDIGDLKGFECLCSPGPLPPSGFGNGCRYPDGRVI